MLFRPQRQQIDPLTGSQRRQHPPFDVVGLVVHAFAVDRHETGVGDDRTGGAKAVAGAAGQIRRDRVQGGRDHLAGDGALPDQLVQRVLIGIEVGADGFRRDRDRGRTDRFVRLLGVLGLGLEQSGAGRHIVRAVALEDQRADLGERLLGEVDRIGAHVGDQTDRTAAGIDALVQLLGDPHGALGGETHLARGFLLQGRGGERRGGMALALLAFHLGDPQPADGGGIDRWFPGLGQLGARRGQQGLFQDPRPSTVGDTELGQFLVGILQQAGGERLTGFGGVGFQAPVLPGLEPLDFLLALDDHP